MRLVNFGGKFEEDSNVVNENGDNCAAFCILEWQKPVPNRLDLADPSLRFKVTAQTLKPLSK
jgi:hypothetical protein